MARPRQEPVVEEVPELEDDEQDLEQILPPEQMPKAWQALYNRAIKKGCSEKAARLYADAHMKDDEDGN